MRFANPWFLWLLVVAVPLLTIFMIWAWKTKQKMIRQFVQSRLLASLTVGVSQTRQKLKLALMIAAVGLAMVALARPQWGFAWEEAKQKGLDIIVAVDTSKSMLATDVVPNRLERAKLAALDLMKLAKSDRLGLISFAGTAFLQSPLTLDEAAFRQNVDVLSVNIIPEGGTEIASAIDTAVSSFEKGTDNHKVLILFTDGEDHDTDGEALAAAQRAAKAGLKIFTIGVGTAEGELLRVKDEQGNMVFIKDDDNNVVKSHLNETLLQKIATTASGFYLPLRGANPMETLYSRGLAPLPKSDTNTKLTKVYRERFYWPLGLAILCLITEMFLPERKLPRRPEKPAAKTKASATTSEPPITAKGTTVAILLALALPVTVSASSSSAFKEFQNGNFGPAFEEYERLAEKNTNDYRLHYNAGTAAYQAKDLESAQKHLTQALNSPEIASDLKAQQKAYFNLGNTEYQLGVDSKEPDKQQEFWENAITNFDRALKLDTKDTNADSNLKYVQQRLEQLKKMQQQQQSQDGKDNKKNKNQKDQQDDKQQQNQLNQKDQKDQKDQQQKQSQQNAQQDQKNGQKKDQKQAKDQDQDKQKQQQAKAAQAKKDKDDKDKKDKAAAAAAQKDKSQETNDENTVVSEGQMTREQAKKILDEEQQNEKALIFSPENQQKKEHQGKIKDW